MAVVYEETGLQLNEVFEDVDNPTFGRHNVVTLQKGSTGSNNLRKVTALKNFGSPESSPFDMTKTYKVTIEEE